MSRVVVAFGLAIVALNGALAAQGRPDLSGRWEFVADKSTPTAAPGILGQLAIIEQTATTLTVTGSATTQAYVRGGQELRVNSTGSVTHAYLLDSAEHDLQTTSVPPQRKLVFVTEDVTYRAIWTTGQLVVIRIYKASAASTTDPPGQLQRMLRTSYAFDTDGSLVVEGISIGIPKTGGPKEDSPRLQRSVYQKAKTHD